MLRIPGTQGPGRRAVALLCGAPSQERAPFTGQRKIEGLHLKSATPTGRPGQIERAAAELPQMSPIKLSLPRALLLMSRIRS